MKKTTKLLILCLVPAGVIVVYLAVLTFRAVTGTFTMMLDAIPIGDVSESHEARLDSAVQLSFLKGIEPELVEHKKPNGEPKLRHFVYSIERRPESIQKLVNQELGPSWIISPEVPSLLIKTFPNGLRSKIRVRVDQGRHVRTDDPAEWVKIVPGTEKTWSTVSIMEDFSR